MASGGGDPVEMVPSPILALANFIRGQPGPTVDAVAVPTSSGWITLHASLPEGRANGCVAVVLERAMSPQATAVRLEADGVTPREREVATLLRAGSDVSGDRGDARPLALHRAGPHQESVREDRRVISAGVRRPRVP